MPSAARPQDHAFFADGTWPWIALIIGWFAAQAALRLVMGGALAMDEAQIILDGRSLEPGYGPQPPLYAWLQWGAFRLIGDPLVAMASLKNGLIAVTFIAVFLLLRGAVPTWKAGMAAVSLMLLPQIAWESHRALTHSVLATALAALTCLVFVARTLPGRGGGYLSFGIVAGLGLLSKASYVVVPPALVLAALTVPDLRAGIRWRGMALAACVAAAIVAGPLIWGLANTDMSLASVGKMHLDSRDALRSVAEGTLATATAAIEFVWLPIAFCLFIRRRHRSQGTPPRRTELETFLIRAALVAVLLTLAGVLATRSTAYHARWMQPALYMTGPLCALWLIPRVKPSGTRALRRLVIGIAVLVTVALPIDLVVGIGGNPQRMSAPFGPVLADLDAAYPGTRSVIADREWLAGNLLYARPDWRIRHMEYAAPAPDPGEPTLLVWWRDGPGAIADLAARLGIDPKGLEVRTFSAPYPYKPLDFEIYATILPDPGP